MIASTPGRRSEFTLEFRSLHQPGRGLGFPCDRTGCVDVIALSDRAAANYTRAWEKVGREFAFPTVRPGSC